MKILKKIFWFVTLAAALTSCGPKMTLMRQHKNYAELLASTNKVAIIPPQVEINQVDGSGKLERQYNYEYNLEDTIIDILSEKLRAKNYKIHIFSRKDIHNLKISGNMVALRENYQEVINGLYTPEIWPEEKAFAVEARLNPNKEFNDKVASDLVLFIEYFGRFKTKGAITKGVAANMALGLLGVQKAYDIKDEPEYIEVRIALVENKNHHIIWSNKDARGYSSWFSSNKSIDKTDRKRLNELFDAMLKSLPNK
jgi:hypothetical protein